MTTKISANTIRIYDLPMNAVEVLEAAGVGDYGVDADAARVIRDGGGDGLLAYCLDGCEDDEATEEGWRAYVFALEVACEPQITELTREREAAADEAANDSPAAWKAREQTDYDGRHTDHE